MVNFVSLQTGLTGLRAAQAGIDTTSHNVANANTPGYTRQRSLQQARKPYEAAVGPMGTGVDVAGIQRIRDAFLDARVRSTSALAGYDSVRADLLSRAEQITGEPEAGVAIELDNLWAAFEDLANEPNSSAARTQVLSALGTVTARIRSTAGAWDQLGLDTTGRRDAAVAEINDLLTSVADINRQVMNAGDRPVPPDLYDQRDSALDRIAALTGASSKLQPDNSVTVTLGGVDLVLGSAAGSLSADPTTHAVTATPAGGGAGVAVSPSGELGGLTQFLSTDLPTQRTKLNDFATILADTLNTQHAAGYTPNNPGPAAAGGTLVSYGADPALTIDVAFTNVNLLAAAGNAAGEPFDGANAAALAEYRFKPVGAANLTDRYRLNIVDLGAQVAGLERSARSREELSHAASLARTSMHGVSIDEEMVNLVQYQRALEAATRVMTAVDEALEVLVNRTGLVGR